MKKTNTQDQGHGLDSVSAVDSVRVTEAGILKPRWSLTDFRDPTGLIARKGRAGVSLDQLKAAFAPHLVKHQEFKGNLFLNEGINELFTILCSASGGTKFDHTNACIGAGDDATAAGPTQTGLLAATNKYYVVMDDGYPTYGSSQKATFRATFGTGVGNFSWQEITVANGDGNDHVNLNRKVQDMGSKTSAITRIATLETSIS